MSALSEWPRVRVCEVCFGHDDDDVDDVDIVDVDVVDGDGVDGLGAGDLDSGSTSRRRAGGAFRLPTTVYLPMRDEVQPPPLGE